MGILHKTTTALAFAAFVSPAFAEGRIDTFTINAGQLVQAIYLNDAGAASQLGALEAAIGEAGGEHLTNLEVIQNESQDHDMTHVVLLQWADPSGRAALEASDAWASVSDSVGSLGFFGAQQDTPVELHEDKIYDGTHAWTIAESPEQMAVVQQVLGVYFRSIGPVLQEYQIGTKAFMGSAPGMDGGDFDVYAPQIFGLFEWQKLEDVERFRNDERWLEHVDIRNATFKRDEDTYFSRVIFE
ncbi:hypothetical protein [Tateyamaria sp. SN6-1]|uniref:hypothetical protein n=1 Tax=Tateyamaria sp. SN6-1 TaxID=3092148 RepID=UPI0039F584B6